jgi:hypothetical protein
MTYGQQQVPLLVRLGHAFHRYFFAEKGLGDEGVGVNLPEALLIHARSIDRHTAAIEEANRLRRRENGEE